MNFFINIFYRLIYHPKLNYIIRNLNYLFKDLLLNKIKIPPSGIINLKTDSGNLKMETNQTSYLTQLLFWNGYKSFEYSKIFESLSKDISVFLDIGSNIGYYSLLAIKANPKIKAYAFEPAKGPKHYLQKNIKLNHFENNIIHKNIALSNTTGKIDFYEVENVKYQYLKYNLAGEGNAGTKTTSRNFIKNSVHSETLNKFIEDESIENIDLIKIDTEGTEVDILNSGKESIVKFQPIIICETLFNNIEPELDFYFNSINYYFFNHTPKGLKKVPTIKRNVDDGIRNCFFVPESKLHLISKFVI
ncbi:FkbM family methyltransferase [Lacinutrix iliipiscaria]|uniref:FkbM family methyltransferase n=1 Tax=Lacinutrix iliipiscaria TaxID=1230532 RepID=A0ABW5WKS3_9FLAO